MLPSHVTRDRDFFGLCGGAPSSQAQELNKTRLKYDVDQNLNYTKYNIDQCAEIKA